MSVETDVLVKKIAEAAWDKMGEDPVLVDVSNRLAIADAFVIVSGSSQRQVTAISEEIMDRVSKDVGVLPDRIEGREGAEWVLMDYGEVVVHVLTGERREYYALEKLWADGTLRRLEDPSTAGVGA